MAAGDGAGASPAAPDPASAVDAAEQRVADLDAGAKTVKIRLGMRRLSPGELQAANLATAGVDLYVRAEVPVYPMCLGPRPTHRTVETFAAGNTPTRTNRVAEPHYVRVRLDMGAASQAWRRSTVYVQKFDESMAANKFGAALVLDWAGVTVHNVDPKTNPRKYRLMNRYVVEAVSRVQSQFARPLAVFILQRTPWKNERANQEELQQMRFVIDEVGIALGPKWCLGYGTVQFSQQKLDVMRLQFLPMLPEAMGLIVFDDQTHYLELLATCEWFTYGTTGVKVTDLLEVHFVCVAVDARSKANLGRDQNLAAIQLVDKYSHELLDASRAGQFGNVAFKQTRDYQVFHALFKVRVFDICTNVGDWLATSEHVSAFLENAWNTANELGGAGGVAGHIARQIAVAQTGLINRVTQGVQPAAQLTARRQIVNEANGTRSDGSVRDRPWARANLAQEEMQRIRESQRQAEERDSLRRREDSTQWFGTAGVEVSGSGRRTRPAGDQPPARPAPATRDVASAGSSPVADVAMPSADGTESSTAVPDDEDAASEVSSTGAHYDLDLEQEENARAAQSQEDFHATIRRIQSEVGNSSTMDQVQDVMRRILAASAQQQSNARSEAANAAEAMGVDPTTAAPQADDAERRQPNRYVQEVLAAAAMVRQEVTSPDELASQSYETVARIEAARRRAARTQPSKVASVAQSAPRRL